MEVNQSDAINTNILTIHAPIEAVWQAVTKDYAKWMPSIKLETDWQVGGNIRYTCYNEDGTILQWQGKDMIWSGTITTLDPPHTFTCDYRDSDTGIVWEKIQLESTQTGVTEFTFTQQCVSTEVAANYKEGNDEMYPALKKYLETN